MFIFFGVLMWFKVILSQGTVPGEFTPGHLPSTLSWRYNAENCP